MIKVIKYNVRSICFVALSYKMVEDELALLDKSINEFWNKFKSSVSDTSCQMMALRDTYKDINKAFTGT